MKYNVMQHHNSVGVKLKCTTSIFFLQHLYKSSIGSYQISYWVYCKASSHPLVVLPVVYREACPRMSRVHFLLVVVQLAPKTINF